MSPILRTNRACATPGCNSKLPDGYDLMERCPKCKVEGVGSGKMSRKMSLKMSRKSEGDDKRFCEQCGVIEIRGKAKFCKECAVDRQRKSSLANYHKKVEEAKEKEREQAGKVQEPTKEAVRHYKYASFCEDCEGIIDKGQVYCDTCLIKRQEAKKAKDSREEPPDPGDSHEADRHEEESAGFAEVGDSDRIIEITDSDRIKQIMDLVDSIEGFRVKVIIEKM